MNCEGFSIEISTFLPQTNFVSLYYAPRQSFLVLVLLGLCFALACLPCCGTATSGKGKRLLARRAPHHQAKTSSRSYPISITPPQVIPSRWICAFSVSIKIKDVGVQVDRREVPCAGTPG